MCSFHYIDFNFQLKQTKNDFIDTYIHTQDVYMLMYMLSNQLYARLDRTFSFFFA